MYLIVKAILQFVTLHLLCGMLPYIQLPLHYAVLCFVIPFVSILLICNLNEKCATQYSMFLVEYQIDKISILCFRKTLLFPHSPCPPFS